MERLLFQALGQELRNGNKTSQFSLAEEPPGDEGGSGDPGSSPSSKSLRELLHQQKGAIKDEL